MTRKSLHPIRIQIHLDITLLKLIDQEAATQKTTRAEAIRMILKRGIGQTL